MPGFMPVQHYPYGNQRKRKHEQQGKGADNACQSLAPVIAQCVLPVVDCYADSQGLSEDSVIYGLGRKQKIFRHRQYPKDPSAPFLLLYAAYQSLNTGNQRNQSEGEHGIAAFEAEASEMENDFHIQ